MAGREADFLACSATKEAGQVSTVEGASGFSL